MANVTNIPAPRVPFIDDRTGLMAREWYRFFLNLFLLTGSGSSQISLVDVQVGPDSSAAMAKYDEAIKAIDGLNMTPVALPQDMTATNSNTVLIWLSQQ